VTSQPAPAVTAEEDFAARWHPDPDAVTAAVAALNLEPAAVDLAAIPVYFPGKEAGYWTTGQEVRTVPGVVFCGVNSFNGPPGLRGYDWARNQAARAAWAAMGDQPGTVGWATVRRDGTAHICEDHLTREQIERIPG
jgi:hypothetical protein